MALEEGEIWGEVTDRSLEVLLERKGVPRTTRGSMMSIADGKKKPKKQPESAFFAMSAETVGRFGRGFADMNPLYHNPGYAAKSPGGRIIAPPAANCYAETTNGASDGFPGCHTIWRGVEYDWKRPMFADEVVKCVTYLKDANIIRDSKFAGGMAAVQDYETRITTMEDEYIGAYRTSWHRFSRGKAKESKKYADIKRHTWTDEELDAADVAPGLQQQPEREHRGDRRVKEQDDDPLGSRGDPQRAGRQLDRHQLPDIDQYVEKEGADDGRPRDRHV